MHIGRMGGRGSPWEIKTPWFGFTLMFWGCNLGIWRLRRYLTLCWHRRAGVRLYWSYNATPWGASWLIGRYEGKWRWR
jgi:hypothetical protein